MHILIIGADSKLGLFFTEQLNKLGYKLYVTGKNKFKLNKIKEDISNNIEMFTIDLASIYNCKKLFNQLSQENIDIVINCTNISLNKSFLESSIDDDLDLIDNNISSIHTITKLFIKYFEQNDKGIIFNFISNDNNSIVHNACNEYLNKLIISVNYELNKKENKAKIICFNDENKQDVIDKINEINKK